MRIMITRKCVAIMDLVEEYYPEGSTIDQMLEIDRKNVLEDPTIMDDHLIDDEITVKLVKECL